jgi:hypothetical protein
MRKSLQKGTFFHTIKDKAKSECTWGREEKEGEGEMKTAKLLKHPTSCSIDFFPRSACEFHSKWYNGTFSYWINGNLCKFPLPRRFFKSMQTVFNCRGVGDGLRRTMLMCSFEWKFQGNWRLKLRQIVNLACGLENWALAKAAYCCGHSW